MKKYWAILFILTLFTACVEIPPEEVPQESVDSSLKKIDICDLSEEDFMKEAGPVCESFLQSFIQGDYKTFTKDLKPELKSQFTSKIFQNYRKSLIESCGKPVKFTYGLNFRQKNFRIVVYKMEFQLKNEKNCVEIPFIFQLGKVDNKLLIFGVNPL